MSDLPLDQSIQRFKDNEERHNVLVNGTKDQSYTAIGGGEVPSVRKFFDKTEQTYKPLFDASLLATQQARDDARAAAAAAGPFAFFQTYALAVAAVATIPNDAVVEITADETRQGFRTRYFKRAGNTFQFALNMDQLQVDLRANSGSTKIGHGAKTVGQVLDEYGVKLTTQGSAAGIVTESGTKGSVQDVLNSTARATAFRSKIEQGVEDVQMLLQGDSTGNEDWEFFYKLVRKLCAMYPTHSFYYRLWNESTQVYDNRVLQTGTGPRVVRIYNGSVPGANAIYWQGSKRDKGFDGWQFDLVLLNYGLNTGEADQLNSAISMVYNMRTNQPDAEIVMTIQPPDYTDAAMLARSVARNKAQRQVASAYGVGVIDAYSLFANLVNKTGNVNDWYLDKIHPNENGQALWAQLALASVLNTSLKMTPLGASTPSFPNANLSRWPAGNAAAPLWWAESNGATIIRDTGTWETYGGSARGVGAGAPSGTGVMRVDVTELVQRNLHMPVLTFAARVYTTGDYKPGTLSFVKYNPSYTELRGADNGYLGVGAGGWRWAVISVPRSFFADGAAVSYFLDVFTGPAGEMVRVDRVVMSSSLVISDTNGDEYSYKGVFSYNDDAFPIPAKSFALRNIGSSRIAAGCTIEVRMRTRPTTVHVQAQATGPGAATLIFLNNGDASVNVLAQQFDLIIR